MNTPTTAGAARLSARPPYPPPVLVPAPPAAAPRRFTVQVSPRVYVERPLPPGLDAAGAERYLRAYAVSRGQDCRLEYPAGPAVYCLSDGTRFEAAR
ncbi:MAG: hypothetical protein MUF78_08520 [Candidatus Edwardsbacteria bacterium]|jgi:hypothetical protein|nr:hypothetical protein [Candidatus Edwardsbacteria bacterium]